MENFSMVDFNYFDIIIAAIVLLLGIKGFINGFVKKYLVLLVLLEESILLLVLQILLPHL